MTNIPNPPEPVKRSRSRDKLIPLETMQKFDSLTELGVPVAVARRKLNIDILQSTCSSLLKYYKLSNKLTKMKGDEAIAMGKTMHESLFPSWLVDTVDTPKNMVYYGYFPYGYWEEDL